MTSWHSYPKIYNLGHAALTDLFKDDVTIEEKVDGSQFSFGKFGDELKVRSKGAIINPDCPEGMFEKAVETAKTLFPILLEGHTYRAEYLQKAKHNSLAYDRVPNNHLIIFDISPAEEVYLNYEDKRVEALRLGLEVVPLVFSGKVNSADQVFNLMDCMSILGGQKIEGLVIKNYKQFGPDKKVLLGKHVSEDFKEVHKREWKSSNPTQGDILQSLGAQYSSPARWNKAIQHLNERGELENSPRDIGKLLKEVSVDIHSECVDEIKAQLFKWAWPHISRAVIRGLPEWYKDQLVKSQFDKGD